MLKNNKIMTEDEGYVCLLWAQAYKKEGIFRASSNARHLVLISYWSMHQGSSHPKRPGEHWLCPHLQPLSSPWLLGLSIFLEVT